MLAPEIDQPNLFEFEDLPRVVEAGAQAGALPLWTESKAALIAGYLRRFVNITHHGTYIDGFAGPQRDAAIWSAPRVVGIELLQHFFLCDRKPRQIAALEQLMRENPGRDIRVVPGDFNRTVDEVLASGVIDDTEASFALLDQRTFECQWSTVQKLARHKQGARKVEQFYFLANGWLDRALSKVSAERARGWWGQDGWQHLDQMHGIDRANLLARRFNDEFGYAFATCWAIYERKRGRRVMYFMIHAADHERAPRLMGDAYREAVGPMLPAEELVLPL